MAVFEGGDKTADDWHTDQLHQFMNATDASSSIKRQDVDVLPVYKLANVTPMTSEPYVTEEMIADMDVSMKVTKIQEVLDVNETDARNALNLYFGGKPSGLILS